MCGCLIITAYSCRPLGFDCCKDARLHVDTHAMQQVRFMIQMYVQIKSWVQIPDLANVSNNSHKHLWWDDWFWLCECTRNAGTCASRHWHRFLHQSVSFKQWRYTENERCIPKGLMLHATTIYTIMIIYKLCLQMNYTVFINHLQSIINISMNLTMNSCL